jgi:DnaJ-class molecular chaperone
MCVCANYGERDCPTCHGEGEVSEEREATYFENQRAAFEAMQRVFKDTPQ